VEHGPYIRLDGDGEREVDFLGFKGGGSIKVAKNITPGMCGMHLAINLDI